MPPLGQAAAVAVRLHRDRWLALFAAILVHMVAGGSPFLFPVYSKAIIASLGYDSDKALVMLAFSKNLGGSLGFLPSTLIYDVAPQWAVLPSVAAMNLVGVLAAYLLPYLAVAGHIARPPLWLMCISIALGANSQAFAITGALVSSVKNLPDHRGPVLSLLLAFAGLGGDILAQFGRASDDGAAILLFMACLYLVQLPFACTSIRVIPAGAVRSGVERRGVMRVVCVSAFAGACLLIFHVVDLAVPEDLPRPAYYVTAAFVAVVLVISLVVVAVKQERTAATSGGEAPAVPSSLMLSNNPAPSCFSTLRAVFSLEMMLIFVVTFAIGGGVQTPIDIIDQVGQSLQYKHGTTSKLVSLVTLSDYAGRLVGGFGSEYVVARYKLPRPLALTVALLLVCFGHLLIALGVPNGLYAASTIMGFSLGALWTLVFVTISEVFGARNLAALYNLAGLPSAVGSYIFNVQVTGRLYDRELQRQASTDHTCIGVRCFRESLFILVGVTLLGAVVSAVLALRAWQFYRAPIGAAGVVPPVTFDRSNSNNERSDRGGLSLARTHAPLIEAAAKKISDRGGLSLTRARTNTHR